MKKAITPLALLACAVLFASGCSNTGAVIVTGLRVELTGVERTDGGAVTVSWRLINPNVTPYLLAEVTNRIFVNGTLVGTTLDRDPMGLPANGQAAKASQLVLAGPAAAQMLATAPGTANYRVESDLVIQIYGNQIEKGSLTNSGTVAITGK